MRSAGRSSFFGLLADVVFPGRCLGCGQWLLGEEDSSVPVCARCLALLPSISEPRCDRCGIDLVSEHGTCLRCRSAEYRFHSHRSLFPYTGMAKCLLQALKFERRTRLAVFFSNRIAYELKHHFNAAGSDTRIVPVPPRPGRREPDAVERISSRLASAHGLAVCRLLERTTATQQKSLGYEQRRANLRESVRVRPGLTGDIPESVILLDDVFTTGATMDACAHALLDHGCRRVDAVTLVMEE